MISAPPNPPSDSRVAAPASPPPPPWLRPALLLGGALVVTDGLAQVAHAAPGGILGLGALATGWWVLGRGRRRPSPSAPRSVEGWMDRCQAALGQFERFEGTDSAAQLQRRRGLDALLEERGRREPALALVSSSPPATALQPAFAAAQANPQGLRLLWGNPLPSTSPDWQWPEGFERADLFLFHLHTPLRAAELRWLEALPPDLALWILVQGPASSERSAVEGELQSQWPAAEPGRILLWNGDPSSLGESLQPLTHWLAREARALRGATPVRCLRGLHGRWQAELEALRRGEWRRLQQRTQWLVAAGVAVAPLPSLDLLVLAVANGLMLREMARLWDCPWSLEQLRAAATELARAALAQGVVEWSTQALVGAARLHGATWLVGGAVQALSAAYLTRVVGRAMADMLALTAGVSEPDLEAIRRRAPLLVARAAETEKLDWAAFLQQGRRWLQEGGPTGAPNPAALNTAL